MFIRSKFLLKAMSGVFCILSLLSGCASVPRRDHPADPTEPERFGVYHKVKKGETIWQVARAYNLSTNDIINTNHIPDAAQVEEGQLLFIPGAVSVVEIVPADSDDNDFIWPMNGKVINYYRDKDGRRVNKGINIQGKDGDEVMAAQKGEVVFADNLPGYGQTIIVEHRDGFHTLYSQNEELLVGVGDRVERGEKIARLGGQKDLYFLHFQVRKDGIEDNPFYFLPRGSN